MTGFGRAEGRIDGFSWTWELRSVNAKGLDFRFRAPPGWDVLEQPCKQLAAERLKRGSVSASLSVSEKAPDASLRINEAALHQLVQLLNSLEGVVEAAPPRLDGLLAIRGVVEVGTEEASPEAQQLRRAAMEKSFADGVADLLAARLREGGRIGESLRRRLDEIASLVDEAESSAAAQPGEILARLRRQLAALSDAVPALSEERLMQEVALLMTRADIREELDRLSAHTAAARELLAEGVNVGRRLDFLCQEFNREANTICSKSADLGLTRIGLALKAAIEQLREQVQNIE